MGRTCTNGENPTERELALIEALLGFEFDGHDEVASQIRGTRVADDCGCGCGSFAIERRPEPLRVTVDGPTHEWFGRDDAGNLVGLFIMVKDGYVEYVENYGLETVPVSLPTPESLRPESVGPPG